MAVPMVRLVLLAHGSRESRWRAPLERLLTRLHAELGQDVVRLAYLELATPTLAEVADEAARDEVATLRIWPMFIAAGGHLEHDLPKALEAIKQRLPRLQVEVLAPLGEHAAFVELVADLAAAYLTSDIGP